VLDGVAETGMGYHLVLGKINGRDEEPLVVASNFVLPFTSPKSTYYSIEELTQGSPPPWPPTPCALTLISVLPLALATSTLPPGYLRAVGAVALLGSHAPLPGERYFRCIATPVDFRFVATGSVPVTLAPGATTISVLTAGTLLPGTYLASERELPFIKSGFGAVGRLALPLPVAASHVFEYVVMPGVPPGLKIKVGTVAPAFGQAGGAAEVQTDHGAAPLPVRLVAIRRIDDF
jgi:hypothetical protein